MFAFLGVVAEDDMKKGIIEPSYILCKSLSECERLSGYRIVAADSKFRDTTKVLITAYPGHEDLIELMSKFRTTKYRGTKYISRRVVHGTMFWFPCNHYGERIDQPPIFITNVPVEHRVKEEGKKRLEAVRENQKKDAREILTDEPFGLTSEFFNVKRKMPDTSIGRRYKDDGNEEEDDDDVRGEWGSIGF